MRLSGWPLISYRTKRITAMVEQFVYYTAGLVIVIMGAAGLIAFLFGEWLHHMTMGED